MPEISSKEPMEQWSDFASEGEKQYSAWSTPPMDRDPETVNPSSQLMTGNGTIFEAIRAFRER
jgi:hypothetical protein